MASNKVAIVIPAYNEEKSIHWVVKELQNVLNTAVNDNIHIVVVNDNSSDNTTNEALKAGVKVLDLAYNHGYSKAIEQGLHFACDKLNAKYLITMDADGQHDPESVKKVLLLLKRGKWAIVAGKRKCCARIAEKAYAAYFQHKLNIADPLCGLKGYQSSVFKMYGKFETFDSIGSELLTWSTLQGYTIIQPEVHIRERQDTPRFGGNYSANKRIFMSLCATLKYIKKINLLAT